MNEDIRYLKKNVKTGSIDVHPTEKALVVYYEMQATLFGETGMAMGADRKECQKIIRVKNLDESTNIPKLAQEIISSCNLIQPSKLPEVEHLLKYLLNRKEVSGEVKPKSTGKPADPGAFDSTEIDEVANLNETENYLELLYEDVPEKLRASALILQLARNPDNLGELYDNGILIGALARVLKEDWKASTDLATNIIYIFFCFSSFSDFHHIIVHFKIGALTMNILDHELKKYDMWLDELQKRRAEQSKELDKTQRKFDTMVRKQEQLFRVSFYLLLNVAEDVNLEVRMLSKNLIEMLAKTLERKNNDLLILVVSFLKKLSIYQENLFEMNKQKVAERLVKHITNSSPDLLNLSMRLLLNLSFNAEMRQSIVKANLIPKLVQIFQSPENGKMALKILYNISCEDKYKPYFIKTECLAFLLRMILDGGKTGGSTTAPPEVVGLAVNLVCHYEIASITIGGKGLRYLMRKAYKTRDCMLMKMLRNISQHDSPDIKMCFADYIADLAKVITASGEQDTDKFEHAFVVECVGILANLTLPDLDFEMILTEFELVSWLGHTLQQSIQGLPDSKNDLLLGAIMLVGTVANDDTCARMVAEAGLIQTLIELIAAKQEDDEIVCQIVYVFYQLIFHKSTREIIVDQTQAPAYIIDLMHDKNPEIRKVCDWTLDIIGEFYEDWARKIQEEKFKWYNSQWLEMIEGGANTPEMEPDDEDEDMYQHSGVPNYPFESPVTAGELISRYGRLVAGIDDGGPLDRMGASPNLDPDLYGEDYEVARSMYRSEPGSYSQLGYGPDLPYDRPLHHPGFRSDMATVEHSMSYDQMAAMRMMAAGGGDFQGDLDDDLDGAEYADGDARYARILQQQQRSGGRSSRHQPR